VIQIFTRNQRQWDAKPVSDEEAATFRASVAANRIECVMSHASYLLNLGAPSIDARRKSAATFREELARCAKLGVQFLNFHPGAHLGGGDAAAIDFIADCVRDAIETTPDSEGVTLLIENTAGQGTCVGHRFEHLAELLEKIGHPDRLGVCLDTQHSFAAGYDVKSEAGLAGVIAEFDRLVGLERLRAFHLNDSKVELGRRVDRHECLGKGAIGFDLFARLMNDPRFAQLPGFLETPLGPKVWKREIARLRKAVITSARGSARAALPPRPRARPAAAPVRRAASAPRRRGRA
jgi:deoxyribonuclease-4